MKVTRHLTAEPSVKRERFFALKNPRDVADLLEVPYSLLIYIIYKSDSASRYKHFTIPKRSGGTRAIMSPNKSLKILQGKLNSVLATVYKPKPAAHGFVQARSIVTNAKPHCGQRLVLNIDLKDFFPTINFGRVRGLFIAKPYGLPAAAATVLAQLCCYNNQLPQGAPTSPTISNMICSRLDTQLELLAERHKCAYTRYADDITFSTYRSNFAPEICSHADGGVTLGEKFLEAITSNGFVINYEKLHLQRWDSHQEVTGLTVNRKVNAPRRFIRQVRAMLHAWKKHGLPNAARVHFKRSPEEPLWKNDSSLYEKIVRGKIAYLAMVRGKDGLYRNHILQLDQLLSTVDPALLHEETRMNPIKVFISHSGKDVALATALVHCLDKCLQLSDGDIRCTSVPGYRLDPGSDAHETLRTNLEQCKAVIGLLTDESLKSGFVFMELGAAWGLRKITYPLLGATIDFGRIPGPLATTHAIKVNSETDIAHLVDVIATSAGIIVHNRAKVTDAVRTFVDEAAKLP